MKNYIYSFLIFLTIAFPGFGQDMQAAANTNYVLGDLEKLDKLELTKIYIAKINKLSKIVPYIPFGKLEPKTPNDIKIPSTSINEKAMSGYQKNIKEHTEVTDASLSNIIPYADKKNIIDSIMFLQEMIQKIEIMGMEIGKSGKE